MENNCGIHVRMFDYIEGVFDEDREKEVRQEDEKMIKSVTSALKKSFSLIKAYNKFSGLIGTNIKCKMFTDEEEEILTIFSKYSAHSPKQISEIYLKTNRSYDEVRWLIRKSSELNIGLGNEY